MARSETHVVPSKTGGWEVVRSGSAKSGIRGYATKKEAERRARELARRSGGGEVVVHGRDGMIRESDTIPPDSRPAKRNAR